MFTFIAMTILISQANAAEMNHMMKCNIQVDLAEAAEKQLGGAAYSGPKLTTKEIMTTMKKAHLVHHPQRKGAFFMAPNKMNHVEVVYSESCGVRVYVYNAYTVPISVNRFLAYVEFVPRDDDQFEVTRFLQPSKNGGYLVTGANHGVKAPFDIRLFMKFPDSDDVELFTVKLESKSKPMVMGTGIVVEINQAAGKLVIDQKSIPGYMGAMTMPYAVSSPHLLEQVKPGMDIKFRLDKRKNVIVGINPFTG